MKRGSCFDNWWFSPMLRMSGCLMKRVYRLLEIVTDGLTDAEWFRTAKNRDVSTGPLTRPFARLLALLTHSLAPLACSAALIRSLTRSLPSSWESLWLDVSKWPDSVPQCNVVISSKQGPSIRTQGSDPVFEGLYSDFSAAQNWRLWHAWHLKRVGNFA